MYAGAGPRRNPQTRLIVQSADKVKFVVPWRVQGKSNCPPSAGL